MLVYQKICRLKNHSPSFCGGWELNNTRWYQYSLVFCGCLLFAFVRSFIQHNTAKFIVFHYNQQSIHYGLMKLFIYFLFIIWQEMSQPYNINKTYIVHKNTKIFKLVLNCQIRSRIRFKGGIHLWHPHGGRRDLSVFNCFRAMEKHKNPLSFWGEEGGVQISELFAGRACLPTTH